MVESYSNQQQLINQSIEDMSQFSIDHYASQSQADFKDDAISTNNQDINNSIIDQSLVSTPGGASPLVFVFGQNSYGELGLGKSYVCE